MKSKVKEFLVLPVICIILAICLAVANGITAPIIAANADKATNALREAVLPDAGGFEKIEVPEETMTELGGVTVHKAANGSGIAIQVVTKGYGGDMNVMVGVDKDGGVTGVKIVSSEETPGLGKRTEEPSFIDQFNGKSGELKLKEDITPIGGATISSKAVTLAVNNALKLFETVKGEI